MLSGIVCFRLPFDLRPGGGSSTMEGPPEKQEDAGAGEPGDRISLHNFSGCLAEQRVHFHSMRLRDSLFLWIGEGAQLSNLAVAMCTPRVSAGGTFASFGTQRPPEAASPYLVMGQPLLLHSLDWKEGGAWRKSKWWTTPLFPFQSLGWTGKH